MYTLCHTAAVKLKSQIMRWSPIKTLHQKAQNNYGQYSPTYKNYLFSSNV